MNQKILPTFIPHSQRSNDLGSGTGIGARDLRLPLLRPGPKIMVLCLPILVAAVAAMSTTGTAQLVSALMASAWLVLVPSALFQRWAAWVLPCVSAGFAVLALLALPFNTAAFVGDVWAALTMFFVSFPRRS